MKKELDAYKDIAHTLRFQLNRLTANNGATSRQQQYKVPSTQSLVRVGPTQREQMLFHFTSPADYTSPVSTRPSQQCSEPPITYNPFPPNPFMFTDARTYRAIATAGVRMVAFLDLPLRRKMWRVTFTIGRPTARLPRPLPKQADHPLMIQPKNEEPLIQPGIGVGMCDSRFLSLFLHRQRLLGEETAADAARELGLDSSTSDTIMGAFSAVYYSTGAVKHARSIIDSSGTLYSNTTLRENPSKPTGRNGNSAYGLKNRISIEVDMIHRVLIFLVDNVRQPVCITNLPESIHVGVCLFFFSFCQCYTFLLFHHLPLSTLSTGLPDWTELQRNRFCRTH